MKKWIKNIFVFLIGFYIFGCVILYFYQENIIFYPEKLDKNYSFHYGKNAKEMNFKTKDEKQLNGILFEVENPKGLIFYLHGNSGSLRTWGKVAELYNILGFDVFVLDYRGFGKSEGDIINQEQLFQDNQLIYDFFKTKYSENNIIILGYSIGTGLAAKLASENNPKHLILQAPYYSLIDLMEHKLSVIPTFILKYKFKTNVFLKSCKSPVTIFHGNQDEVIYYGSSEKLKKEFKKGDTLITLNGQRHNGMTDNYDYQLEIARILKN